MRKTILKPLLAIVCLLSSITLYAHDFEVDGIYYNITSETDKTVEVTSDENYYVGSVVIPETVSYQNATYSVTSIGVYAFFCCTGLTEVTIGSSVTSIGDRAFAYCILNEISIPNSVTSIRYEAFYNCTSLTEVTIGNSVTSIGEQAFAYCFGLTEVTIPNSVNSIGDGAFRHCTGLTEITIPNNVTSIGYAAFGECISLTTVNFNAVNCATMGSEYNQVFDGSDNLSILNIGDAVTTIPDFAFAYCSSLKKVTIPNSVTSIGERAFYNCTGLTEMRIEAVNPPAIYDNTFEGVDKSIPLYVPAESVEAYRTADYWEYFINVLEDLSNSAVEDITCDNNDVDVEYYDLNGCRVDHPTHGIYIMKQGNTVKKVVL